MDVECSYQYCHYCSGPTNHENGVCTKCGSGFYEKPPVVPEEDHLE